MVFPPVHVILGSMHCPFCQNPDTKVIDTRISDDGHSIRRRRVCPKCSKRFTTVETSMLLVTKRSGGVEPFSRDKVISGVRKACQGRPVREEDLKLLLAPMANTGKEPLGSMGNDAPMPALSSRSRMLFDYFTQKFAQVTNPPLDWAKPS